MWNSLAFSENYFSYISNTERFNREDIGLCLADLEMKRKVAELSQERELDRKLTSEEKQKIKMQIYNSDSVLELWQRLSVREYERHPDQRPEHVKHLNPAEYSKMLVHFFQLMVRGFAGDRLQSVQRLHLRGKPKRHFNYLVDYSLDPNE